METRKSCTRRLRRVLCTSAAMVWPWTLTFWPQNLISSSLCQGAPVTKVWQKSIDRYWTYRGNIKFSGAFGHAVTLTFDLLTPKCIQFISVPRCTSDKSLAKIRQQILEISPKHKTTTWITDARTHARTVARTDDPKTYSLRRRLPAAEA